MEKLFLTELQKNELSGIQASWIEQIEKDQASSLEITNSYFDYLMTTENFGDLLQRSNQSTYMAVRAESNLKEVYAITSIIFARQGSATRCKIMDITHAPQVDQLDDKEYEETTFRILIAALAHMLDINKSTRHGITKVYAKNETLQIAIDNLRQSINASVLESIGFTAKQSGRLWLEFETTSQ